MLLQFLNEAVGLGERLGFTLGEPHQVQFHLVGQSDFIYHSPVSLNGWSNLHFTITCHFPPSTFPIPRPIFSRFAPHLPTLGSPQLFSTRIKNISSGILNISTIIKIFSTIIFSCTPASRHLFPYFRIVPSQLTSILPWATKYQ